MRTIFEHIDLFKRDDWVEFRPSGQPTPTQTVVGSRERIAEYRRRLESGEELFSPSDGPESDQCL